MTAKTTKNSKGQNSAEHSLEQDQSLTKPKSKTNGRKTSKASIKKALSRKEKLEAARKANQAMMKAWKLISQRNDNGMNV